jgi:hypothetical protein
VIDAVPERRTERRTRFERRPAATAIPRRTLDDDNVNETVDFGFRVEKVAVGNYVFMDNDATAARSMPATWRSRT